MTLEDLLREVAAGLAEVRSVADPDGSASWTRAGRAFAVISADRRSAEFALDPAVAMAAVRTPDTSPSARGPGWVLFSPDALDDHGFDRARAWLLSAHRQAGSG